MAYLTLGSLCNNESTCVGVYDYSTSLYCSVRDSKTLFLSPPTVDISEDDAVLKLTGMRVVIGHFSTDRNWNTLCETAASGSICIRTSTVGRAGYVNRVRANGVVELNLIPRHTTAGIGWNTIIESISAPGVAQNTAEGTVPEVLRAYFAPTLPVQMISLAILCQGYLAVTKPERPTTGRNGAEGQVGRRDWWSKAMANPLLLKKEWSQSTECGLIELLKRSQTSTPLSLEPALVDAALVSVRAAW